MWIRLHQKVIIIRICNKISFFLQFVRNILKYRANANCLAWLPILWPKIESSRECNRVYISGNTATSQNVWRLPTWLAHWVKSKLHMPRAPRAFPYRFWHPCRVAGEEWLLRPTYSSTIFTLRLSGFRNIIYLRCIVFKRNCDFSYCYTYLVNFLQSNRQQAYCVYPYI